MTGGTGIVSHPFVLTAPDQPERTISSLTGGPTVFNTDFFLQDDELPALPDEAIAGDTIPGFIIRARAQNVWNAL